MVGSLQRCRVLTKNKKFVENYYKSLELYDKKVPPPLSMVIMDLAENFDWSDLFTITSCKVHGLDWDSYRKKKITGLWGYKS